MLKRYSTTLLLIQTYAIYKLSLSKEVLLNNVTAPLQPLFDSVIY